MNVRGYIRCSTNEQTHSGLGLQAQRNAIETACEARGYQLIDIYEDAGYSGGSMVRPAITRLIDGDLKRGEALMAAKLCRVSRSLSDYANTVARFKREGRMLIVLDPDLDLATPNGRLVANVLASVLEWERDIIGQRTSEALRAKIARGERVGAEPLIVGDLAEEIRALKERGLTYRAICGVLNERGTPTPKGGSVWRPSSLQGVLARA